MKLLKGKAVISFGIKCIFSDLFGRWFLQSYRELFPVIIKILKLTSNDKFCLGFPIPKMVIIMCVCVCVCVHICIEVRDIDKSLMPAKTI